ncbi:PAAR domain-containing protein [Cupriavidus necator]|uniref:PAAR domain-containing protein n=1 Tax=Cupriavidus necator TaxID=106590 RepID=UPI00339D3ED5
MLEAEIAASATVYNGLRYKNSWRMDAPFKTIAAYVLVFEDDDGDACAISSRTDQGLAITCFFSPFDAMLEAGMRGALGRTCEVAPASLLDGNLFRDADGAGFIADIHLGWPACDGCLLQTPSGAVGRYAREMHHWAREAQGFEVDAVTLEEFAKLREAEVCLPGRKPIENGDTTTANGTVIATSRSEMLNGRASAYECDPVWCPKCKTTGKIVCVGERLPSRGPDGREQALSYDWCLCKCDPKPLLIASHSVSGIRA